MFPPWRTTTITASSKQISLAQTFYLVQHNYLANNFLHKVSFLNKVNFLIKVLFLNKVFTHMFLNKASTSSSSQPCLNKDSTPLLKALTVCLR